jgi:hypothetical protein
MSYGYGAAFPLDGMTMAEGAVVMVSSIPSMMKPVWLLPSS